MGFQNLLWNRSKIVRRLRVTNTFIIRSIKKGQVSKTIWDEINRVQSVWLLAFFMLPEVISLARLCGSELLGGH